MEENVLETSVIETGRYNTPENVRKLADDIIGYYNRRLNFRELRKKYPYMINSKDSLIIPLSVLMAKIECLSKDQQDLVLKISKDWGKL